MLKIHSSGRYLCQENGEPFFYLADTAWELFHRPTFADVEMYLRDRAEKRFTVIQAVILAEFDGLGTPNAQGHLPLVNNDPLRPNEAYFADVDRIVAVAEELGLHLALLPCWGDKWNRKWGVGPEIFHPANACSFGAFLGRRYRGKPIIWILGGDRPIENDNHRAIIEAMAEGLREGGEGQHLMTFHPPGALGSTDFFPDAPWLDFHMRQTSHARNSANYEKIASDYEKNPSKPCLDGEPGYEDHPSNFQINEGYLDDYDVRKAAYWSLFAGACGHTYGCHPVWGFWEPPLDPVNFVRHTWREALDFPGARQMRNVRALMESRPFFTRVPDQSLIASAVGEKGEHIRATRDSEGSYAMIYLPVARPVLVDLAKLTGIRINASWYDPRTGQTLDGGSVERREVHEFIPPAAGPDWILILDDASE
jgi:Protein of unknown function (DUF4038)/Putative collagen-binding domain of a collagenase